MNVATDSFAHIDAALTTINGAFAARLDPIGQPTYGTYQWGSAWKGGVTYTDYNQVYIVDTACTMFPTQGDVTPSPFTGQIYLGPHSLVWRQDMPTGCNASTDPTPLIDQGNAWRASYVTTVTGQLSTKYNASDQRRADLASVRAALSNVIATYSTAL